MSTQAANVVSQPPQTEMPLRYTRTAMVLHWLIALLIICNVVLGLTAESFPDSWVRSVVDTHKSIGITVLASAAAIAEGVSEVGTHGRSHRALLAVSADDRSTPVRLAA
jgi:hypothetical protein